MCEEEDVDVKVWCRVQSHLEKICKFQLLLALSPDRGNYCVMVISHTDSCELNEPGGKCRAGASRRTDASLNTGARGGRANHTRDA